MVLTPIFQTLEFLLKKLITFHKQNPQTTLSFSIMQKTLHNKIPLKTLSKLLFLLIVLFVPKLLVAQKTIFTVKGVKVSVAEKNTLFVNGSITVDTLITDNNVDNGDIANSGTIYLTDSLYSNSPKLFYTTSNPYRTINDKETAQTSMGKVVFTGSGTQYISSTAPHTIFLHNVDIKNSNTVTLKDTTILLGSLDLDEGNLFLNGHDLLLYYDKTVETKYGGNIIKETTNYKVYDNTVPNYNGTTIRSGHIKNKLTNKDMLNASGLGIRTTDESIPEIKVERGHVSLPYAAKGGIKKYYIITPIESNDTENPFNFSIKYLDSDFDLSLQEPNFRVFLKHPNSNTTYTPLDGDTTNQINNTINSYLKNISSVKMVTVADSICDDPPRAIIASKELNVCAGAPFTISIDGYERPASQSINTPQWWWEKEDKIKKSSIANGITDTLTTPQEVKYFVKTTDNRGCFSLDSIIVNCHAIPTAEIEVMDNSTNNNLYCLGDTTKVKANPTTGNSSNLSYNWSLGDGETSSGSEIEHTYQDTGSYTIQLTTSTAYCSDTKTIDITINPLPEVQFTTELICDEPLKVKVTNTTENTSDAIWMYRNAEKFEYETRPKEGETPVPAVYELLFSDFGTKTIVLEVTNNTGCVAKDSTNITLVDWNVDFTPTTNICLGNEIGFSYTLTNLQENEVTERSWDFNDGTSSDEANPTKQYQTPGNYTVTLTVTANGCTKVVNKDITVHPRPNPEFTVANICQDASITLTPIEEIAGSTYQWCIGNSIINSTSTSHSFNTAGTYTITLTETTAEGCSASSSKTIAVFPKPTANFNFQSSCEGTPTIFLNTSSITGGTISQYQWSVDGIEKSNEQNPELVLTSDEESFQVVTLKVTSNNGCSNEITKSVDIYPIPNIKTESGTISFCSSSATIDATASNITNCSYVWNDGIRTPMRTINREGSYTVTATSSNGCQTTKSYYIKLNSQLEPISQTDISFCGEGNLRTNYNDNWCHWVTPWGEEISGTNSIVAKQSGLYSITVTDSNNGCSTTSEVSVTVSPKPAVTLGNDLSLCHGDIATLTPGGGYAGYNWSTGETSQELVVSNNGQYQVTVTDANGCTNADTIRVTFNPLPPKPFATNQITQCSFAELNAGGNSTSYLWSTGETTRTITVYNSNSYWVKVSNNQCSNYDTLNVTINHVDGLNLGSDLSICEGNKVTLSAGDHASSYAYIWNNRTTTANTYTTGSAGRYVCKLVNTDNGCFTSDTLYITLKPKPIINLGVSKSLCNTSTLSLDAGNQGSLIQWGSTNGFSSIHQKVILTDPGKYWVTVMNEFGCVASDTLEIFPSSANINALFIAASKIYAGDTIVFKNMSYPMPYNSSWNFGDGTTAIIDNPQHVYYYPKTFEAKLTVSNGYCTSEITKPITVIANPGKPDQHGNNTGEKLTEIISSKLYPNPTSGHLTFELEVNDFADVVIGIYSLTGQLVKFEKLSNSLIVTKDYNLRHLAPGIYILKAWVGTESVAYKIVKTN